MTYKRATRLQGQISQEGAFFRGLGLDLILAFPSLVTRSRRLRSSSGDFK